MAVGVPDVSRMLPIDWYVGEDDDETAEGAALLQECVGYLESFDWCDGVVAGYVGLVVPGVIGVALLEITPLRGADPWIWVVGGDLPFAYMEFDDEFTHNAIAALECYVGNMEDWVAAVTEQTSLDEVFPVAAAPTAENAELLRRRLSFIEREIIPNHRPVIER